MSSNDCETINQVLQELENKKKTSSKSYWNVTWIQGSILKNFIEINKPKNVLEVGTSNGFSTLWMVKGLQNLNQTKIYTVEVDKLRFDEAKNNFSKAQVKDKIIQIRNEVINVLEEEKLPIFDFVFLDAGHKNYKEIVDKLEDKNLLNSNCILIADNIISHTYMRDFVKYMQEKYWCEEIKIDSGFLVAIKSS